MESGLWKVSEQLCFCRHGSPVMKIGSCASCVLQEWSKRSVTPGNQQRQESSKGVTTVTTSLPLEPPGIGAPASWSIATIARVQAARLLHMPVLEGKPVHIVVVIDEVGRQPWHTLCCDWLAGECWNRGNSEKHPACSKVRLQL